METINNWLLQNTGNAGNYYTILNTEYKTTPEESAYIEVMARDKDYKVVNLLIYYCPSAESEEVGPDQLHGRIQKAAYRFRSEEQVLDYLSGGKISESTDEETGSGVQLLVLEPTDNSGTITFPPVD